jgi:hypothetical protein
MEKVRLQAKKFEERYMKPGAAPGFKKPWTVDEALAQEVEDESEAERRFISLLARPRASSVP